MLEADSRGFDQHTKGAKLDKGKLRAGLVLGAFSRALAQVCAVGTFGANKYTDNGWLSVPEGYSRYTDAMLRHWLAEQQGAQNDPESDLLHQAHLAWNALARLELLLIEVEVKEGPKQADEIPKQAVFINEDECTSICTQCKTTLHFAETLGAYCPNRDCDVFGWAIRKRVYKNPPTNTPLASMIDTVLECIADVEGADIASRELRVRLESKLAFYKGCSIK